MLVSELLPSDYVADEGFSAETRVPVGTLVTFIAFSTRVHGKKTVLTGCGIGGMVDGELKCTAVAQKVVEIISKHSNGKLTVCECRNTRTAKKRALDALRGCKDGEALMVLCKDDQVVDAVLITKTFGMRGK